MKKVYFYSTNHPCTENAMNINLLKRWYGANSWETTKNFKDADVLIVSTCGFSQAEENMEIKIIKELGEKKKKDAELIITGCLPQINKESVEKVFNGKYVKILDMEKFDEIMGFDKKIAGFDNNYVSEAEYDTDPQMHRYFKARKFFEKYSFLPFVKVPKILYTVPSEKWFLIRAAMGCTGNCTYCGIKHAHGFIQSESIEDILELAKKGISKGYKELALTGPDQGAYGFDLKTDLVALLTRLLELDPDFKVNLRYIEPHGLIKLKKGLMPIFKTGRVTAFCSPVQSGSNEVLNRMKRRYTFEDVKETVDEIMETTGVSMISTNIIVGFPGETDKDFEASLRLVDEVRFGLYMAFKYEDRPNTLASKFENKIGEKLMNKRYDFIQKKIDRKHLKIVARGV